MCEIVFPLLRNMAAAQTRTRLYVRACVCVCLAASTKSSSCLCPLISSPHHLSRSGIEKHVLSGRFDLCGRVYLSSGARSPAAAFYTLTRMRMQKISVKFHMIPRTRLRPLRAVLPFFFVLLVDKGQGVGGLERKNLKETK